MLENVEPDVHLVSTLMTLSCVIPAKTKDTARQVVRKVVEDPSPFPALKKPNARLRMTVLKRGDSLPSSPAAQDGGLNGEKRTLRFFETQCSSSKKFKFQDSIFLTRSSRNQSPPHASTPRYTGKRICEKSGLSSRRWVAIAPPK